MEILKHNLQFKTLSELNNLVSEIINVFNEKNIKHEIELSGEIENVGDRLANRHYIKFTANNKNYILDGIFAQSYFEEEEAEYLVVAIYDDNDNYLENIRLETIL